MAHHNNISKQGNFYLKTILTVFLGTIVQTGLCQINIEKLGFSPHASGVENTKALQKAVERGGTISIQTPGTYKIAGTVYVGDNTTIEFGNNVFLKKVDEQGSFSHVFLNKGALTKTYNENIAISGLNLIVNEMDRRFSEVYGLRGQIAFFYVKNLRIQGFQCLDLEKNQFGIHVCTFENLTIADVTIKGKKDGIHLGRGKRFTIRDAVFQTFDDAIALNAHDYATSNPELGWIEDGVIENCHDLNQENTVGYFCRILAGGWVDWQPGMEVQQSDIVVSNGTLYRVQAEPDGKKYKSVSRPNHKKGSQVYDGINWGVVQDDVVYTAGVRNVVFRDIFLKKPRIGFSIHFDNDRYSRSYYPGAKIPKQERLLFDNVQVLHEGENPLLSIATPVDVISLVNSVFNKGGIRFVENSAMPDYFSTSTLINGCVFKSKGEFVLLDNSVDNKEINLKTRGNIKLNNGFKAIVKPSKGRVDIDSDLEGLRNNR